MEIVSEEEQAKRSSRRRFESELIILQSDRKKIERKEVELADEIRRLRTDVKRLEIAIQEKEAARKKLDTELMLNEAEALRAKKRITTL